MQQSHLSDTLFKNIYFFKEPASEEREEVSMSC